MMPRAVIEAQLYHLENQLLQAEVRRSREALSSLLADEFREFGSSGQIFTKADILAALAAEEPAQFSITDFLGMELSPGVALVTYQAFRHSASMELLSRSLRSSIWVWRDDRWQILFHQGTRI